LYFISLAEEAMLQVQALEIPEKGLSVEVADSSWFPVQEISRRGKLQTNVFLSRDGDRVNVSGSILFILLASCDRCLVEFELPKSIDFSAIFDLGGEDPALLVKDYECDKSEIDVVYLEEPIIDLGSILSQQIIMALPRKNLCCNDCLGLCHGCGENLNTKKCSCKAGNDESPFSVLSQLAIKK
jgi:uncharacterized protein